MDRQARHIVRLVDDLLDVSRISHGKIDLKIETLDLCQIVSSVIEAQKASSPTDGLRQINWTKPSEEMMVKADQTRAFQIISNLLNNALKYSEPPAPIDIYLAKYGDGYLLSIKDYGIGIRTERLNEIFDMFEQGKDVLNRAHGGLGIGLTIVKRLIEMHGGSVWAESDGEFKGATFYAQFPAVRIKNAASEIGEFDSVSQPKDDTAHRILVVDDNRDAAEMVEMFLTSEGFRVACSFDGRSALSALDQFRPDLVLLDIGMPGLNGFETNMLIKEREQWRNLPVFALTGFGNGETVERLKNEGFVGHFIKPADLEEITRKIKSVLDDKDPSGNDSNKLQTR